VKKAFALVILAHIALYGFSEGLGFKETPFSSHIGPRFGVSYTAAGDDEEDIYDGYYDDYDTFDYRLKDQLLTSFGVNMQQRFKLGTTEHRFAFQQGVSFEGLETEHAVFCLMLLMGFQTAGGLEFAAGPAFTAEGRRIAFMGGYEFRKNEIYVPIDVTVMLPKDEAGITAALTVGFNFNLKEFFF
jgi:hypothetical protein